MTFKPYEGPVTLEEWSVVLDLAVPGFEPARMTEMVGLPRVRRMCREIRCTEADHQKVSMFAVRWARMPFVRMCDKCAHRLLDLQELTVQS